MSNLVLRRLAGAFAVVNLAIAFTPAPVDASCNLIPAAQKSHRSTLGGVLDPLTAPGDSVEIRLNPQCDSASAGFDPTPANNVVTVTFEPPGGGATTDVVINPADISVANALALSFVMPDSDDLLAPMGDGLGLAGPASILVEPMGGGAPLAAIGPLYQPTSGCDQQPDTIFAHFTVLPPANVFADLEDGTATRILATLDGGNNLLVPLDYWGGGLKSVLPEGPGSPVARILDGAATVDAFTSDPGVPLTVPASGFVRSFTLDGRPLPPLLRVNAAGDLLFGTADAVESVLRIARNDGMGGGDIHDFTDRLFSGKGPIVLTNFLVTIRTPAPLKGLRSDTETVVYVRDELAENLDINLDADTADRIVQVIDAITGADTNTSLEVVESQTGNFLVPALETDGVHIAMLELDPAFDVLTLPNNIPNSLGELRVFEADGDEVTIGMNIKADPAPRVSGKPLQLSSSLVFFLSREPDRGLAFVRSNTLDGYNPSLSFDRGGTDMYTTRSSDSSVALFKRNLETGEYTLAQQVFDGVNGVDGIQGPISANLAIDNRNLYVASTSEHSVAVFDRDEATGELTFREVHFDGVGGVDGLAGARNPQVSLDGKNLYVCGPAEDALAVFTRDPPTGALTFLEAHFDGIGGVTGIDGCLIAVSGPDLYVTGTNSLAVFTRDPLDGSLAFLEAHFDGVNGVDGLGNAIAAISSGDGAFVYASGKLDNAIATFSRNLGTGELTFLTHVRDGVGGVDGIGGILGFFLDPQGDKLYAAGSTDNSLAVFDRDPGTGLLTFVEAFFNGVDGVTGLSGAFSPGLDPSSRELLVSGLGEIATFRVPTLLQVYDIAGAALRPTAEVAASFAAVADGRAVVLTPEEDELGMSLNGDGDADDHVAQLYDGNTDSLVPLGLAATAAAISSDLVALAVSEADQAGVDRNGDGDSVDSVLAVRSIGGMTVNVGTAADTVAASAMKVAFVTPEAAEDASDLNGDGDALDRVLRIYDHDSGTIDEVGQAVEELVAGGSLVAFRTSEAAQGSTDLNGDGDTLDAVMQVYDLAAGGLLSTGQAAIPCTFGGCDPFFPYKLRGDTVSFVTREADQGATDLNGDGDAFDTVMQVFHLRSRVLQVVDLSGESKTLSPFPDDFSDGSLALIEADETDAGADLDGDGVIEQTTVVLVADADGDGVLDDFDTCVESANPDDTDPDADGLGNACDPAPFCSTFTPAEPAVASIAGAECQKSFAKALLKYTKSRSGAAAKCLDGLGKGTVAGAPAGTCRGAVLAGIEIGPNDTKAAKKIAKSRSKLSAAIAASCSAMQLGDAGACAATPTEAAACASMIAGEAAVVALEQAYGELGSLTPAASLKCQKTVGKETTKYLVAVAKTMASCLDRRNAGGVAGNGQIACLGGLVDPAGVVLPSDAKANGKIDKAEATLRGKIAGACASGELGALEACGADASAAGDCLVCTAWRRAYDVVHAVYGP